MVKNDVSSYKNDDDIFSDMRKATPELLLYSFLIKIVTYLVHKTYILRLNLSVKTANNLTFKTLFERIEFKSIFQYL